MADKLQEKSYSYRLGMGVNETGCFGLMGA